jgi:hypothetical protein
MIISTPPSRDWLLLLSQFGDVVIIMAMLPLCDRLLFLSQIVDVVMIIIPPLSHDRLVFLSLLVDGRSADHDNASVMWQAIVLISIR